MPKPKRNKGVRHHAKRLKKKKKMIKAKKRNK
jgi:hypothetical protein